MSSICEATLERLDAARMQWWLYSLLCGVAASITIGLLLLGIIVLIDVALHLEAIVRAIVWLLWCGASLILLAGAIFRAAKCQRSRKAAARRVEFAIPHINNDLINIVQLAESDGGGSASFREAAIQQAVSRTANVSFEQVAVRYNRPARWKLALHSPRDLVEATALLVVALGLLWLLGATVPEWSTSIERILWPW